MSTSTSPSTSTCSTAYDLVENPIFEVEVETTVDVEDSGSPTSPSLFLAPGSEPGHDGGPVEVTMGTIMSSRWPLPPTEGMYEKIVYIDHRHNRHVKYIKIADQDAALASGQFEPVDFDNAGDGNVHGGIEVRRRNLMTKNGVSCSRDGKQLYTPEFILKWGLQKLGHVSKPFVCPVPTCKKAYKNANGIRYHARYGHSATSASDLIHCFCGRFYTTRTGFMAHQKQSHRSVYRRNIISGKKVGIIKTTDADTSKDNLDVEAKRQQKRQEQEEQDDLEIDLFMNTVRANEVIVEEFGHDYDYDEDQEQQVKIAIQQSMGDAFFELERERERNRNLDKENENEDMILDSVQEFMKLESRSPDLMNQMEVEEEEEKVIDNTLYTPKYILHWGMKKRGSDPVKPYECPVPDCKKAYKNPNGIKYHSKFGHVREKEFKCDCGRNFMTGYGYFAHQKSVHGMPSMTLSVKDIKSEYNDDDDKLLAPIFQNGQSKDAPIRNQNQSIVKSIIKKSKLNPLRARVKSLMEKYGKGKWSYVGNININQNPSPSFSEDFKPVYINEELHSNSN